MSINSLTNDEIRRQAAIRRVGVSKGPESTVLTGPTSARALTEFGIQENPITVTLNALVKYIPTEVVTLYVAAASASPALKVALPVISAQVIYWGFGVVTPLLLLLLYASKRATDGLPALPKIRQWPWWKMAAATVAFLVWALAVPGNPYVAGDGGAVVAGFGAVIVSSLLSLLEPIFERPQSMDPPPPPVYPEPTPMPQTGESSPGKPSTGVSPAG